MSLNPSWRPSEDETTIISERTWLAEMIMTCIAYGVVFTLFVLTFKELIRTTTKQNYTQRVFLIYITLMFILGTLYLGSIVKMTELGFIDYRLFPGGPAAFEKQEYSLPISEISSASSVTVNGLTNGLLIYRYLVIFRCTHQFPLWVIMFIPVLAYLASLSLSVVWLIQASAPVSSPWNTEGAINFLMPYCWMWFSLNIFLTIAICTQLLFYRKRVASIPGMDHGTQYLMSVAAMLVESSFLSSTFILLFFLPYALNSPIQNAFIRPSVEIQIIANLLIIYRVAYGAGWVSKPSKTIFGTKETRQGGQYQMQEFTV